MGDNIPVKYPAYFGKLVLRSGNEPERDHQQHHVDTRVSRQPSQHTTFLSLYHVLWLWCGIVVAISPPFVITMCKGHHNVAHIHIQ